MRSDTIKRGHDRAPHRGLLKACGLSDADLEKFLTTNGYPYQRLEGEAWAK